MTNTNHERGARAERQVAAYLRSCGFWMAERYLREGRTNDMGDIDGVPFTTVQVKDVVDSRYPAWITGTLRQQVNARTPYCLLVRRVPYKPVAQWEALMPLGQLRSWSGSQTEAWTWVRMDLRLAVVQLQDLIAAHQLLTPSAPSLSTTSTATWGAVGTLHSVPSTGSAGPA